MADYSPGDRVRAFSSWTGKTQGQGTVQTATDTGCDVELDKHKGAPAHFYNSELTKVVTTKRS